MENLVTDASSVKLKLYTTGSDNEAGASAIGTYEYEKRQLNRCLVT